MTKDQFISLIDANFNTGQLSFITGNKVYNAFFQFCDMVFGATGTGRYRGVCNVNTNPMGSQYGDFYFASYNSANAQTFTNFNLTVQAGELCIFRYTTIWSKSVIGTIAQAGGSGTMTAPEIRDALETLTAFDRLSRSSILHGEGMLNYLGKDNFSLMTYNSGNVYKGDFFIHEGNSASFKNGDWAIALEDAIDTEEIPTSPSWLVIPFGKWTSAFSADIDGNVTFEKNVAIKGQAYSQEHAVTITPSAAVYEEYVPNFDNSNVFRITSNKNLLIKNPVNRKNGSTFLLVIRAEAAIEVLFDTDFLEMSTIALQTLQTIIISGVVSNSQILCDQSKVFGATTVPNPPILDSIVINSGSDETGSRIVSIMPTFTGGGVPTAYAVKEDAGSFGEWTAYTNGSFNYNIQSINEGTKTLGVKFRTAENEESEVKSDSILLVESVPSLSGISINNGAASTSIRNVQVYLQGISGLGAKQVRLSNDNSVWGSWIVYTGAALNHTLTETNGTKTVYLQIKNIAGTQATTYSDTIQLSTVGFPDLLGISINSGATETSSRTVSIALSIGNGTTPTHYAIQENEGTFGNWTAYSSSPISHTIAHAGDGAKAIGVKMKDADSNESPAKTANILLVTEAATLGGITINNGDNETQSKSIQIAFSSVTGYGQKQVAISESELSLSNWTDHNVNLPFPFTLSTGNGLKNIYAKVKNIAGASDTKSDSITLNEATSVQLTAFSLNSGNPATNQTVPISFTASGSPDKYMISESSSFTGASWQNITGSDTYTLSRGNGSKIVYFKVKRSSDNVESSPLQTTITMTIAAPTVAITSITGTAPNVTINTSATNAYKMKVVELDEGATPNWSGVAEADYNAAKSLTLAGIGNRVVHVQVISYGDQTALDSELYVISSSLLNTFKMKLAADNQNLIVGTTDWYGWPKKVPGAGGVEEPLKLINTLGQFVGVSGSEIKMAIASDSHTNVTGSVKTPVAGINLPNFPIAALDRRLLAGFTAGTTIVPIKMRLFNLNNNHTFTFRFASSVDGAGNSNNYEPQKFEIIGSNTGYAIVNPVKNNLNVEAVIENISPNNGEIIIRFYPTRNDVYIYAYANAMIIEQYG